MNKCEALWLQPNAERSRGGIYETHSTIPFIIPQKQRRCLEELEDPVEKKLEQRKKP
jgi:hypothetical protein